jgi:hypothetical protein
LTYTYRQIRQCNWPLRPEGRAARAWPSLIPRVPADLCPLESAHIRPRSHGLSLGWSLNPYPERPARPWLSGCKPASWRSVRVVQAGQSHGTGQSGSGAGRSGCCTLVLHYFRRFSNWRSPHLQSMADSSRSVRVDGCLRLRRALVAAVAAVRDTSGPPARGAGSQAGVITHPPLLRVIPRSIWRRAGCLLCYRPVRRGDGFCMPHAPHPARLHLELACIR